MEQTKTQVLKVLDITIPGYCTIDKVNRLSHELRMQGYEVDFKRESDLSFHMQVEVDPEITPDKIEEINQLAVSMTY